jgi:hypothetical protein
MKLPLKSEMSSASGRNLRNNKTTALRSYQQKVFFLFIQFLFISVPTFSQQSIYLCKTWKYISITDSTETPVKRVGENDLMILSDDSSGKRFSYALAVENIKAKGSWEINDSTLQFIYEPSALTSSYIEIRNFKIIVADSLRLQIQEVTNGKKNGLRFNYTVHK